MTSQKIQKAYCQKMFPFIALSLAKKMHGTAASARLSLRVMALSENRLNLNCASMILDTKVSEPISRLNLTEKPKPAFQPQ